MNLLHSIQTQPQLNEYVYAPLRKAGDFLWNIVKTPDGINDAIRKYTELGHWLEVNGEIKVPKRLFLYDPILLVRMTRSCLQGIINSI